MTTLGTDVRIPLALSASADENSIVVELDDGRQLTVPIAWYPRLLHATDVERANIRLIGRGEGLHWPDVEEDVSVAALIEGKRSFESPASLQRWLSKRTAA